MAEHVWTVICNKAITDRDSNQISLVAVCEKIIVGTSLEGLREEEKKLGGRIAAPVQLDLVCWWVRSDYKTSEVTKGRIRLVAPDGTTIPNEYDIKMETSTGWRPTIKFQQFPISHGPGIYWFENQVLEEDGWATKARLPIEVAFEESAEIKPEVLSQKPVEKAD